VAADIATMIAAGERQHAKKFGTSADLARLPGDVTANRILITSEAAALVGYSIPHWREMYRDGRAPAPIRLSARRYGWKIKTLLEWLDEKAAA
jgi:predicted DNA-binding transcriptional regulator AlpA